MASLIHADMNLGQTSEDGEGQRGCMLQSMGLQRVSADPGTEEQQLGQIVSPNITAIQNLKCDFI